MTSRLAWISLVIAALTVLAGWFASHGPQPLETGHFSRAIKTNAHKGIRPEGPEGKGKNAEANGESSFALTQEASRTPSPVSYGETKTLFSSESRQPGSSVLRKSRIISADFKYPLLRVVETYAPGTLPNADARLIKRIRDGGGSFALAGFAGPATCHHRSTCGSRLYDEARPVSQRILPARIRSR